MLLQPKEELKKVRKAKFTQEIFAEKVAIDTAQYNRRERGKIPITENEWNRFAKALEVNIEDIMKADLPLVNITHHHGENDQSVNGYKIIINVPKGIFNIFNAKFNPIINLMQNNNKI